MSTRRIGDLLPLELYCDSCGLVFTDGKTKTQLRDNAKARGWVERHRFNAVRDYCHTCAGQIVVREEIRRKGRR